MNLKTKRSFRSLFFAVVIFAAVYLLMSFWAVRWVNNHSFSDAPGMNELFMARKIWQFTPAFNKEQDSEQARKFSWLIAQAKIYKQGKKDITRDVLNPLAQEFTQLSVYYRKNHPDLSHVEQYRLLTQLMTYLNRVLLYERYSEPRLEKMLNEISPHVSQMADPDLQENWLRERMIYAYLVGNDEQYKSTRSAYIAYLERETMPANLRIGAIAFFDGILACARKTSGADSALKVAHKMLQTKTVLYLFSIDLNALLFGKGMEETSVCNPILRMMLKGES